MRFIPTKFHAPLDYIVGAALIAAPWIFQFSEHTAATVVLDRARHRPDRLQPVHELRARRLEGRADGRAQPDRHRRRHVLVASPWIFGFADESANVWVPFVVVGLAAIFLGLTTVQQGGYSTARAPRRPRPAG